MLDAFAALTQALAYCGIVLSTGSVFVGLTLHPGPELWPSLRRLGQRGAWLTIGATLTSAAVLAARLGDAFDSSIVAIVLTSNVGAAAGLRVAGAVLLLLAPSSDDPFDRGMALSAAALVLASFVFSGHAAAEAFGFGVLAGLHVGVVAWWLVALLAMRSACRQADGPAEIVGRFSALAVRMIAILVVAGVALLAALVEFEPFEFTAYARNLAIKLGLVALVFALAAYNKFVLTSGVLSGDADATAKLRRSLDIELAMLVLVLIATSVMTTYTSPHE
jgi:putative copper export protein